MGGKVEEILRRGGRLMNAQVGRAVNLYSDIEHVKLRLERMERDLQAYVNVFSERDMAEYIKACGEIDRRVKEVRNVQKILSGAG